MPPERWKLLALCLATFMLLLDITIVQAALPAIGQRLGAAAAACSGRSTRTRCRSRR